MQNQITNTPTYEGLKTKIETRLINKFSYNSDHATELVERWATMFSTAFRLEK